MTNTLLAVFFTAFPAYLLGSLNFAVIISKYILDDDVRQHGSGNAGFSNMMRSFGLWPAAATLAGDVLKGCAGVVLGRFVFGYFAVSGYGGFLGAYCVMAGHVFPVFFGFKGGKAIASALGVIAALDPLVFLIIAVVFIPIVPLTGYVSLASILGAVAFPLVLYIVRRWQGGADAVEVALAALLGCAVIFLHRENIKRLLMGTENKLTRKSPPTGGDKEGKG